MYIFKDAFLALLLFIWTMNFYINKQCFKNVFDMVHLYQNKNKKFRKFFKACSTA